MRTETGIVFLENQKAGYAHLFDAKTGTFVFGWDATRDRLFGWEDAAGNYTVGHMNYLVNEFRGPLMFVTLRHGFPAAAVANAGFTDQAVIAPGPAMTFTRWPRGKVRRFNRPA